MGKQSAKSSSSTSTSTATTTITSASNAGTANENLVEKDLHETARWPYEDEDLLEYIDNEEIPLFLQEFISNKCPHLYHSGCIIAQIRDHRQSFPINTCDTYHVLLKPTNQVSTFANLTLSWNLNKHFSFRQFTLV